MHRSPQAAATCSAAVTVTHTLVGRRDWEHDTRVAEGRQWWGVPWADASATALRAATMGVDQPMSLISRAAVCSARRDSACAMQGHRVKPHHGSQPWPSMRVGRSLS